MRLRNFSAQVGVLFIAVASLFVGTSRSDEKEAIDLLPGNSLDKFWVTKGNWKIDQEGVITLTPREGEKGWSRWDSYLWLGERQYKEFEFDFDYKVQIYESGNKGPDAKLTDHDSGGIIPGVPPTKNAAKPAGEWNHFTIRCQSGKVTVTLNGTVVNELPLDDPKIKSRPESGYIGFQDHALPLQLRKVSIREL